MKKTTILMMAIAATLLAGCRVSSALEAPIPSREDNNPSWRAFCASRGYDVATAEEEIIDEYLDAWAGSAEEEKALTL